MQARVVRAFAALAFPVEALPMTLASHASQASDGITYTLMQSPTESPTTNRFTLSISGINGPSDHEGGRYGVQSFALPIPANFASASPPPGFVLQRGDLSANGCQGGGDLLCFSAKAAPTGSALAAASSLSFVLEMTVSSGSFAGYAPGLKVNWVGEKHAYNPAPQSGRLRLGTPVHEPAALVLLGVGLICLGLFRRKRP